MNRADAVRSCRRDLPTVKNATCTAQYLIYVATPVIFFLGRVKSILPVRLKESEVIATIPRACETHKIVAVSMTELPPGKLYTVDLTTDQTQLALYFHSMPPTNLLCQSHLQWSWTAALPSSKPALQATRNPPLSSPPPSPSTVPHRATRLQM